MEPVNPDSTVYLPNVILHNNCSVHFWLITTSVSTERWILGNTSERQTFRFELSFRKLISCMFHKWQFLVYIHRVYNTWHFLFGSALSSLP